jgi:hypothetical protein
MMPIKNTVGKKLKKALGLSKLKNVMITKLLVTDIHRLFIVFYDSHNDHPITRLKVERFPYTAMIYSGEVLLAKGLKLPPYRPLIKLEDFDEPLFNAKIMAVDLSYQLGLSKRDFAFTESLFQERQGSFTIADFLDSAVSNLNKKWYKDRKDNSGSDSDLTNITWNHRKDEIRMNFRTKPTYDKTVQVFSINGNPKNGANYKIVVQMIGVNKHLGTREEYQEFSQSEQQELVELAIKEAEVRVWANDPSFYFQGAWENLADIGASVYNFPGPNGKDVWNNRHFASGGLDFKRMHLTKHIYEVFQKISDFVPEIARKLNNRY